MNDMTLFLDLILIASGAYCMYTFLRLAVTKRLFKNGLLVPKEKKISDCAGGQMCVGYMLPRLAGVAGVAGGCGVSAAGRSSAGGGAGSSCREIRLQKAVGVGASRICRQTSSSSSREARPASICTCRSLA